MALEKLPNIILLDMLLPKMSGVQVLQALQQHAETARIPVIVLSALPQVNEAKLRAAGAIGYFMKSRLLDDKDGESALVELLSRTARETRERNAATAGD
jgi:CheY-like chemotaxis protein